MRKIAVLLMILVPLGQVRAAVVRTVDGRQVEGTIAAMDAKAVTLQTPKGAEKVDLDDVMSIDCGPAAAVSPMATAGQQVIVAEDGSQVAVKDAAIGGGRLTATTAVAGRVSVNLEGVARLFRPRPGDKPADLQRQREALKLERGASDVLVVAGGGQWVPVKGLVEALDQQQVRFSYNGRSTSMDAATVVIVEMAKTSDAPPKVRGQVLCADGSQIAFAALEFDAKQARVGSPSLGRLVLELGQVASVRLQNAARLTYLSDLTPSEVRQVPYFGDNVPLSPRERAGVRGSDTEPFSWRKDQSAAGRPLQTGGTSYAKGLGLHARCEIAFDLGGAYRQFTAVAGVDDALRRGAARLTVLVDGKPARSAVLLDRAKSPETLRVDVRNARRLTLIADFAEDTYGAGARVNICDPLLTR